MRFFILLFSFVFFQQSCFASHIYLEKEYQNVWCKSNDGKTEVILQDGTRIDCLTNDYAIEFDFANKWAESIGQALYYANCTNKKPGVVLIMEKPQTDLRYLNRLKSVASKYDIKIWIMTPNDMYSQCNKKCN